jgi:Flp pilus assembly protein TadD
LIRPAYLNARVNLGIALRAQGQLEAAAAQFLAALEADPNSTLALRELATCRIKQTRYDAALEPLRHLVQLQPDDAEAHFDLAAACAMTNHPEESNQHFLRAIALKPELRSQWLR